MACPETYGIGYFYLKMSTGIKIQGGIGHEHYVSKLSMRGHVLVADETTENGGTDAGPVPTELLLSSLAACTLTTLRMYVDKKDWEVDRMDLEMGIRIEKTDSGQISHVSTALDISGNVTDEQKERMLEIARKCPIHRLLTNPIQIATALKGDTDHPA